MSAVTNLDIKKEVQFFVSENKARAATNINFDLIKQLKRQGKVLRPALMKNNLISYIIQSPIWFLYEKGDINQDQFAAGLKYTEDCTLANLDNMSKPSYDGLMTGPSSKAPNKEPKQGQIEAYKRIYEVKKGLRLRRKFLDLRVLELFFEEEKTITSIKLTLKIGHKRIKEIVLDNLDLMVTKYKKNKRKWI